MDVGGSRQSRSMRRLPRQMHLFSRPARHRPVRHTGEPRQALRKAAPVIVAHMCSDYSTIVQQ